MLPLILRDLRLVSFTFIFKPSQLREFSILRLGVYRLFCLFVVRLISSWLRPLPSVVKLSVDGCSRGNPGMSTISGFLHDHRRVLLVNFWD